MFIMHTFQCLFDYVQMFNRGFIQKYLYSTCIKFSNSAGVFMLLAASKQTITIMINFLIKASSCLVKLTNHRHAQFNDKNVVCYSAVLVASDF